MSISEAFFTVCNNAQPSEGIYVSLYLQTQYYGGPEEGGWWGNDVHLIAYQQCSTREEAEEKRQAAEKLAAELTRDAQRNHGEQCLREMEWLDARGLEADYLPEVDGPDSYFIVVEDQPGSQESFGPRHYE